MVRLIDADALLEAMKKTEKECEDAMTCPSWWSAYSVIDEQPTAYDVDKVVAELDDEENHLTYGGIPFKEPPIKVADAIEIVKRGGAE